MSRSSEVPRSPMTRAPALGRPRARTSLRSLKVPPWATLATVALLGVVAGQAWRDVRGQQLAQIAARQARELDFDGALADLRKAAAASPRDARIRLEIGNAARTLWVYRDAPFLKREADEAYRAASRLSPRWPAPHDEHARMYALKERYDVALTLLAPALRLDPNNAGYWLEQARDHAALGQTSAAKAALARCLAADAGRVCEDELARLEEQR